MDESHETLKAILLAMGIDDVESMPAEDVANLARQLGVDVPEHSDHANSDFEYAMEDDNDVNLNTAFVANESTLDHGMTEASSQGAAAADSSASAEDSIHDDIISQFCSITGSEPNDARYYLEACGWDLEGAIPLFLENGAAPSTSTGMSTTPPHRPFPATFGGGITGHRAPVHRRFGAQENDDDTPGLSGMRLQGIGGADNDVLMPPLPGSMLGTSGMHEQHINAVLQNMMRSSMGGMTGGDDQHGDMSAHIREMMAAYAEQSGDNSAGIAGMGRRQDRYDEDGVRMPDPVQRQRLVPMGRSYSAGEDEEDRFALGRAEDPSVEWMFPPPRHLSSQATLEKARAQAQQEGRWLLVNIQSHEQFASHRLNRDTWVHETIESILRTTFLFWQRGHTSRDGAEYMRLHRLTDDDLPHIGIIDPRTGAKLLTLTGFMSPDDLCIRLVEFAERRPFDRVSSSAPRSTTQSATQSGNVSGAASNADSGHNSDSEPDRRSLDAGKGGKPAAVSAAAPLSASSAGASSSSSTAVETPAKSCTNYGAPPSEPVEEEEGVVKISIKLSNGKAHARRYRKTDKVAALFAVAASVDDAARVRDFDLVSRYPALSLQTCTDKTLEECGLAGSQLILKFL